MFKAIHADNAPQAIGPYSHAFQVQDTLYLSGQIGLDPMTMDLVPGGVVAQAEQCLTNLTSVLTSVGLELAHIAKLSLYLSDMNDFQVVNEVLSKHLTAPYPARVAYSVAALPKNACVVIDAIAYTGEI